VGLVAGWTSNSNTELKKIKVTGSIGLTKALGAENLFVGGIVGYFADASISSSVSEVDITATLSSSGNGHITVGGMMGAGNGPIETSYATGNITVNNYTNGPGGNSLVGGLAGVFEGNISDSYATGDVTVNKDTTGTGSATVGGLVGQISNASIARCYAAGTINVSSTISTDTIAGGIAGYNGGTITQCVALNPEINTNSGGIVQVRRIAYVFGTPTFTTNYARAMTLTSGGVPVTTVTDNIDGDDGTASTPLNSQSTYTDTPMSWNFTDVWEWDSVNSRPKLRP
jgi:hypothetical protein